MGSVKKYIKVIKTVIEEYIQERKESVENLSYEMIADDSNFRYQLVLMGWHEGERIYNLIFHIDILSDKIWIQEDNTEIGVANLLVEKGLSKQEIILGYFSEFHRQHTEFAVN